MYKYKDREISEAVSKIFKLQLITAYLFKINLLRFDYNLITKNLIYFS